MIRIINLSSLAGIIAGPAMGPYCASKHAVEGMAKSLRCELKPWNIHVSNINPGFMRYILSPSLLCDLDSCSTPILTKGATEGQKTFDQCPVDITSQYTQEWSEEFAKVMNAAAEVLILLLV